MYVCEVTADDDDEAKKKCVCLRTPRSSEEGKGRGEERSECEVTRDRQKCNVWSPTARSSTHKNSNAQILENRAYKKET